MRLLALIKGIFSWWLDGLVGALPGWAPDWLAGLSRAWSLRLVDGATVQAHQAARLEVPYRGTIETSLAGLDLPKGRRRGRRLNIELPSAAVLVRRHQIPLSAKRQIERIIDLDLKRSTILIAEDIVWQHYVADQDGNQILVDQVILRKRDLEGLKTWITDQGLVPGKISVCLSDVAQVIVDDGATTRRRLVGIWPKVNLVAACAIIGLTGLTVLQPHLENVQELKNLRQQTAGLRGESVKLRSEVEARKAQLQQEADITGYISRNISTIDTLRELTVRLPDSVWISDFQIARRVLRFSGFSEGSAAELAIQLSDSPMFENPRLTGPVAVAPGTGTERFEISVDLPVRQ